MMMDNLHELLESVTSTSSYEEELKSNIKRYKQLYEDASKEYESARAREEQSSETLRSHLAENRKLKMILEHELKCNKELFGYRKQKQEIIHRLIIALEKRKSSNHFKNHHVCKSNESVKNTKNLKSVSWNENDLVSSREPLTEFESDSRSLPNIENKTDNDRSSTRTADEIPVEDKESYVKTAFKDINCSLVSLRDLIAHGENKEGHENKPDKSDSLVNHADSKENWANGYQQLYNCSAEDPIKNISPCQSKELAENSSMGEINFEGNEETNQIAISNAVSTALSDGVDSEKHIHHSVDQTLSRQRTGLDECVNSEKQICCNVDQPLFPYRTGLEEQMITSSSNEFPTSHSSGVIWHQMGSSNLI